MTPDNKCPFCVEEGMKSRVFNQGASVTCMGYATYYDEDGVFHDHDPNTVTTSYRCSNDHAWYTKGQRQCTECDYGGIESIERTDICGARSGDITCLRKAGHDGLHEGVGGEGGGTIWEQTT